MSYGRAAALSADRLRLSFTLFLAIGDRWRTGDLETERDDDLELADFVLFGFLSITFGLGLTGGGAGGVGTGTLSTNLQYLMTEVS